MAHLTKRLIDSAVYQGTGNSRDVRWDDNPRGFGLHVYPGGERKAFVLSYRVNGVKRLMSLGDYGVLILEQARQAARHALHAVESEQADPLIEKRKAASAARTGTVQAMFDAYVEARVHDPRRPMRAADYPRRLAQLYINPRFGARQTDDIRRSEIREWYSSLAHIPIQANRALQYLKAAFQWRLAQSDDRPDSRADVRNPCWGARLYPERPRTVRLELTELPRLEAAIDAAATVGSPRRLRPSRDTSTRSTSMRGCSRRRGRQWPPSAPRTANSSERTPTRSRPTCLDRLISC